MWERESRIIFHSVFLFILFNICLNIFEHMYIYNVSTNTQRAIHQSIRCWFVLISLSLSLSLYIPRFLSFFECSFSLFNMLIVSIKPDNMVLNKRVRAYVLYRKRNEMLCMHCLKKMVHLSMRKWEFLTLGKAHHRLSPHRGTMPYIECHCMSDDANRIVQWTINLIPLRSTHTQRERSKFRFASKLILM